MTWRLYLAGRRSRETANTPRWTGVTWRGNETSPQHTGAWFLFFGGVFSTRLSCEAVMLWFVRVRCRHSPGDVQGSQLLLTQLLVLGGGVKFSCSHGFRRSERRTATFLALNTNTLSDTCIYVCIKPSDGLDFYTTYHYLMSNIE